MGVAVTRSISHGKAYGEYSQKKDEKGVVTATFVGAKNMVGNVDFVFDNSQLDDFWMELEEAGRDYVRKGKDVIRDVFAIEWSPTSNESEGWTIDDWLKHAEELIAEIDKVQLKRGKRDPKTKEWLLDENGNKKMFDVPQTDLSHSKWLAYLHTDAKSGIPHLHIMISRYCADGKTLNCDTDIAKKGAMASETLNEKYGWTKAMDIRQQHIEEINSVVNAIMDDMNGDRIDFAEFERRVKAATFTDYKGRTLHYDFQYHHDAQGNIDGYSIKRGNSKFTADQLGQKIVNIAEDRRAEIKDAVYGVLRDMNTQRFDWNKFVEMMQRSGRYRVDLKSDSNGNVVRYNIICDGRTYNASQIGPKLTAKKILREWELIQRAKQKAEEDKKRMNESRQQSVKPKTIVVPAGVNATNIVDYINREFKKMGITDLTRFDASKNILDKNVDFYIKKSFRFLEQIPAADSKDEKERLIINAFGYAVLAEEKYRRNQIIEHKPTKGERERKETIDEGLRSIRGKQPWGQSLSPIDTEDYIPNAIAAKAIEMSPTTDGWREEGALEAAAQELLEIAGLDNEYVREVSDSVMAIVNDILLPPVVISTGGGGGGNNDHTKKKDDDWEWWKQNGITKKKNSGLKK